MFMRTTVHCLVLGAIAVAAVLLPPPRAAAQWAGSTSVARALENSLVSAVAGSEKSVVAIARVSKDLPDETLDLEFRLDPFGRRLIPRNVPLPTDPDFIPNEYATGVVVGGEGLVLTTYHVLAPQSDYYVTSANRRVYEATVKAADPRSDLAILAIKAHDLVPVRLGDGASLRKGQIVLALGNPHAIARDGQPSAAMGIVANLARKTPPESSASIASAKTTLHDYGTLIQVDAALGPGASGGALVDLSGNLVGLLTSLPAAPGYDRAYGYAIPVDATFRRIVDTLKQGREVEYGFLGIQPANLTRDEVLAGLRGARIDRVTPGPGSPAVAAGLKAGDIITYVGAIPILDADQFILEVGRVPVDTVTQITILRAGRRRQFDVRLGKYPVAGRKIVTNRPEAWRGLQVDYPTVILEPPYRRASDPVYFEDAVLVTEVQEDSPAWQAGLRPGMSITQVAGRRVRTPNEFRTTVAGRPGPVAVHLTQQESPDRIIEPGA
jgi:serine protease Do